MEPRRTISFTDLDDGGETVAVVRVVPGVGLTVSKRSISTARSSLPTLFV